MLKKEITQRLSHHQEFYKIIFGSSAICFALSMIVFLISALLPLFAPMQFTHKLDTYFSYIITLFMINMIVGLLLTNI